MNVIILVIDCELLGGIERSSINLKRSLEESETLGSIRILSVRKELAGKSIFSKLWNLMKSLDKETVLISCYDKFSALLLLINLFFNIKLICMQHADYHAFSKYKIFIRKYIYRLADSVICLTEKDASLYKRAGIKNVDVIPNILVKYPKIIEHIECRPIHCAVAGRLVPIKQFDHFIDIAAQIQTKYPSHLCKIFGSGVEKENLKSVAKSNKMDSDSLFPGSVSDIYSAFNKVRFVFITSARESFSMVILEAMACGCIVISYDCPTGPRELINHGVNGFLVETNNKKAMLDLYLKLINQPELLIKISQNAVKRSQKFNTKNVSLIWEKAILSDKLGG
jgi:glycosyltransferase involved in cell wall biosynthesis